MKIIRNMTYEFLNFWAPSKYKVFAFTETNVIKSNAKFSNSKPIPKNYNYKLSTLFLLIVCILLIGGVLFVSILHHLDWSGEICETNECIRSAALLKAASDWFADPCDDFYKFTCGKWSERFPLRPSFETITKFQISTARLIAAKVAFLSAENKQDEIEPVKQCRIIYESCLDRETRQNLGFTTIYELLRKIGLPTVPNFFSKDRDSKLEIDWIRINVDIKKISYMDVLFGFGVYIDDYNVTRNLLSVRSPYRKCPLTRIYSQKINDEKWKKVIKFVMNEVIRNITVVPSDVITDEAAAVIINITSEIRNMHKFSVENYTNDDEKVTHYEFSELQHDIDIYTAEKTNKTIPNFVEKLVTHIFENITNVTIDFQKDTITVVGTEKLYILEMLSYLLQTPHIYIELYLWWETVICMVMSTSPTMTKFLQKKIGTYQPREDTNRKTMERKRKCAEAISNSMDFAITYGIAKRTFSTADGIEVKNMIEEIREAFVESVERTTWMDDQTKIATLRKLRNIYAFIGLPEWIFVEGKLSDFYAGLKVIPGNWLHNQLEPISKEFTKELRRLRVKNERNNKMNLPNQPTRVNAFYSPIINSIMIPLGILTFPFYHLGSSALNYGTIGTALGHELTHGFDNHGRHFDEIGNFKDWWSNASRKMFDEKSRCFLNQYDNKTLKGVRGKLSGRRTLAENIADNGGVNHAFAAYRKHVKYADNEPRLPGFENFTGVQMFFVAFGNIWCGNSRPKFIEKQFMSDPHSPGIFRVNMVVSNSKDFAEAFNCPVGSKMNPEQKCKIW